jgi:Family of unknown function (DUF5309)
MASSVNAFLTTSAKGNYEDLANIVDITQRSDTPIYSMIGSGKAKAVFTEWETMALDAPGDNAAEEARDFSFSATAPAARLGNYNQILEKTGKIGMTQQAVSNAGSAEKLAAKKVDKAVALKTDIEYSLVAANASVASGFRKSGSLSTWATTNVTRGVGGVNGGYNTGTKLTVAPTNGTQRAFTKLLLDDLLQASFSSGAKLRHMFCSPYNKRVFATFMSDANVASFRYSPKESGKNVLIADAEVYQGPLGLLYIHPDFVMGGTAALARNIFALDTDKIEWSWLRKIHEASNVPNAGDFDSFVIQGEGCVTPLNEKAVGVIADVFGMTATT